MSDMEPDPTWAVQPLLDAGFDTKRLRGLAEWIQFEAIAADEDERPASFREIESHMSLAEMAAFREVIRRLKGSGQA